MKFLANVLPIMSLVLLVNAAPALAEEASQPATIEIKPLVTSTSLLGAVNGMEGSGGFGLGAEIPVARKVTAYGDFSVLRLRLSDDRVDEMRDESDDDEASDEDFSMPTSTTALSTSLGARYYTSPGLDSWYGQAGLGYEVENTEWVSGKDDEDRGDESEGTVDVQRRRAGLVFGGGYRWVFGDHVLLRLGANIGTALHRQTDFKRKSGDSTAVANVKKDYASNPIIRPSLELGLGWAF